MKRKAAVLLLLVVSCSRLLGFQPGELDERAKAAAAGQSGFGADHGGSDASSNGAGGGMGGDGIVRDQLVTPCGNQQLDEGEECDGDELGGASCVTAGNRAGGTLDCTERCQYSLRDCFSVKSLDVAEHACAVLSNGKLKCWGGNASGQLGLGDRDNRGEERGELGAKLPFVDLGTRRVKNVTVGHSHTCVLTERNEVICWGDNLSGQLGIPAVEMLTSPAAAAPLDLGGGTVVQIEAGGSHTCARFDSGKIKCWGNNGSGQLGLGDTRSRGMLEGELGEQLPFVEVGMNPVLQLRATDERTCALGNAAIKCWGANYYGRFEWDIGEDLLGDAPLEMGVFLPTLDMGWPSTLLLATGEQHNCAADATGSVKCWGDNTYGQLGYGDSDSRIEPGQLGEALPLVDLGAGAVLQLTAGRHHTCALMTGNRLKCWGTNELGQLGLGDMFSRGYWPDEMGENLPSVDLGKEHTILSVRAGGNSTCVIMDLGRVKCWGENKFGALGAGRRYTVGGSLGEMGEALAFVEL